jgi:curved DNA-binding protein CbpA
MAQQIIRYGYLPLTLKYHPDRVGGDEKQMRELNAAYEGLKELLARQQVAP